MAGLINADADSAKIGFPPPFVYAGLLLLGLVGDRFFGLSLQISAELRIVAGSVCILLAIFLMITAFRGFQVAQTNAKPWKSTSSIVHSGVYRHTRNPMYLAMALAYGGLAIGLSSLGAILLFPLLIVLIQTQVIAREERYLEAKFGSEYRAYKSRVRRWI